MCGRFSQSGKFEQIRNQCGVVEAPADIKPRYNIAPAQPAQVIYNEERPQLKLMRWGLIPSWAKDPSIGNKLINARAESLWEKPAFRNAVKKRRCIIPADGFYEWMKKGSFKQPLRIIVNDGEPFAMAGLWEQWQNDLGETINTFTIITTYANPLIEKIHDRMPVILQPEAYRIWLDTTLSDESLLKDLLKPYPPEKMRFYPVSRLVNNPDYDSPQCIAPIEEDPGLPLFDKEK